MINLNASQGCQNLRKLTALRATRSATQSTARHWTNDSWLEKIQLATDFGNIRDM